MNKGEIYSDKNNNNLYEVFGKHYHWGTGETVILFLSYKTGEIYVLGLHEFMAMTEIFLEGDE